VRLGGRREEGRCDFEKVPFLEMDCQGPIDPCTRNSSRLTHVKVSLAPSYRTF